MLTKRLSDTTNLILSILSFCLTPFLCYLLVELMVHDWGALSWPGGMLCPKFQVANLGIYGGFLLIVMLFTGSFRISGILTYIMSIAFGLAMYFTVLFRGVALYAADVFSLSAAKEVAGGYDYSLGAYQWAGIAIGALGILITLLFRGRLKLNWKSRAAMILIGILLVFGLYAIYFKWDKFSDAHIKLYHPQESYQKYGVGYGFLESFSYLSIDKPEGYSVDAAEEIAAEYIDKAADAKAAADVSKMPNIIVIMDETLCDLQNIGPETFKTNKDVFPNMHGLDEDTLKGDVYVSRIGGGTAIMEFEMLTGNSNAFLPFGTIAYQMLVKSPLPSLASQLSGSGYEGVVASHPHNPTGYNRVNAYPLMGFKETKFIDDLNFGPDDVTIGQYPSDEAAFNEIIAEYEAEDKQTDAPFFAFQVTMQNHTPYLAEEHPAITVEDEYYANYPELPEFLNYMHETDRAFGLLVDYFKKCDEPTVIAIFGDHPPRFDNDVFRKLLGIDAFENKLQEMQARKTPLYIWANYDIEEAEIGPVSTNYISDYVVSAAGVPESGYQMFLEDLHKDVPVINAMGYWGKDGKYYDVNDRESPYWEEIHKYHILEYNNLVDQKHRIEGFFD